MPHQRSPFIAEVQRELNNLAAPMPDDAGSIQFINSSFTPAAQLPKKRIYISGKITGLHPEEYTKLFTLAERKLTAEGWEVVNPLMIDQGSSNPTWEDCLVNDIRQLFRCDAIYMLANWPTSRGARIERSIAYELGKTIIYEDSIKCTTL
jgi:hypothetical protein